MSKIWFKKIASPGYVIPISIEGWIWILIVAGGVYYFSLNLEYGAIYIIGLALTILIGVTVAFFKTK